ncbi:MAG: hypothetical protein L3J69_11500 [Desulfobacula sp.]|nr:hypothetical protein [Desulfobacula sp.]
MEALTNSGEDTGTVLKTQYILGMAKSEGSVKVLGEEELRQAKKTN